MDKQTAILKAIKKGEVGSNIIIHNEDSSIYCILKIVAKEHEE